MAIVPNSRARKLHESLRYIERRIHKINQLAADEINRDNKFSTTYLNRLENAEKDEAKNIVRMLRWLVNDLGITQLPPAFTDAEIDAIDDEIRQHEE